MSYKLKPNQEAFEVVDGPFAGKKYEKGVSYDTIPEHEKHRFETVKPPAVAPETTIPADEDKPKKGVKSNA